MVKPVVNLFNDGDDSRKRKKRSPDDLILAGKPDDTVLSNAPKQESEIPLEQEITDETNNEEIIILEEKLEKHVPETPLATQSKTKVEKITSKMKENSSENEDKSKKNSLTIELDYEDDVKTNCTFSLRQSTQDLIANSMSAMKQKNSKTKINKSKLVDKILREAFSDLEVIYNKK
jgi:hypothetical protein